LEEPKRKFPVAKGKQQATGGGSGHDSRQAADALSTIADEFGDCSGLLKAWTKRIDTRSVELVVDLAGSGSIPGRLCTELRLGIGCYPTISQLSCAISYSWRLLHVMSTISTVTKNGPDSPIACGRRFPARSIEESDNKDPIFHTLLDLDERSSGAGRTIF
jgi:hypothetical protein